MWVNRLSSKELFYQLSSSETEISPTLAATISKDQGDSPHSHLYIDINPSYDPITHDFYLYLFILER